MIRLRVGGALMKEVAGLPKRMEGSRSMLHTDATYFIAQALGYSPEAAYQIVSYNQATDLGVYQPFDETGHRLVPLATCEQKQLYCRKLRIYVTKY